MKLYHPPRRRDNEIHLIPLINIVFLLLIFFMLTARLSTPEPFEVPPPPRPAPTRSRSRS